MNERITAQRVRLIGEGGEQLGIFHTQDAQQIALEKDLDLVEVAPNSDPPVARIMDYGKFKYEAAIKAKKARKHQATVQIKEIKFRPKIDKHDYETKKKHVMRFLEAGAKVKITIMFRGREMVHPEQGLEILWTGSPTISATSHHRERAQAGRPQRLHADRADQGAREGKKAAEAEAEAARGTRHEASRSAEASAKDEAEPAASRRRSERQETRHAQDEDPPRRRQALQGHRHRQAQAGEGLPQPHPRAQEPEAEAQPRPVRRSSPRPT